MATRKIEVNEDDLKKVILILKQSKPFLNIPTDNLSLQNLWRVSSKLADKLMKNASLMEETVNGRLVLKPVPPKEPTKTEPNEPTNVEEPPLPAESVAETKPEEIPVEPKPEESSEEEPARIPRNRKRKKNK